MSGSSLHVSWPDWSLFKFPPASYPPALPPPSDEATFKSPFPINEKLYNDLLSPYVPLTIATVYATTVTLLNAYNRRRGNKPWAISKTRPFYAFVILHNVFLALYSAVTFIAMIRAMKHTLPGRHDAHSIVDVVDSLCKMHGPRGLGDAADYDPRSNSWGIKNKLIHLGQLGTPDPTDVGRLWNEGLAFWGWFFYLSKFYEVLDTAIIIAKGKRSSTLQTYHHAGAMLCMWAGIRYMSPPIWMFVCINSGIHALMYTYYTLSALGVRVPQRIKRALTTMQIAQFVIGTLFAASHLFVSYTVPISTPYTVVTKVRELVTSIASAASSAVSDVAHATASAGVAGLLKKIALRAAGEEGLAENVRNSQGQVFGADAERYIDTERHDTRYRNEYQRVDCINTSGQAFAIWLNLIYLLPLTVLFVRFFIRSYTRRGSASAKHPTLRRRLSKSARDAAHGVDREIETLGESIEDQISIEKLTEKAKETKANGEAKARRVSGAVKEKLHVFEEKSPSVKDAKEAVKRRSQQALKNGEAAAEKAKGYAGKGYEKAREVGGQAAERVQEVAGQAAGAVRERAPQAKEQLQKSAETVRDKAGEAAGVARDKAGDAAGAAKNKLDEAAEAAREKAPEVKERASEAAGKAKDKANETMEAAQEKYPEVRDKAKEAAGTAKEKVDDTVKAAQEKAPQVKEEAQKAAGDVKEKAQDTKQNVKQKGSEAKEDAEQKAGQVKEDAKQKAGEAKETAEEKGQEAKDSASKKTQEAKDKADEKADEAAQESTQDTEGADTEDKQESQDSPRPKDSPELSGSWSVYRSSPGKGRDGEDDQGARPSTGDSQDSQQDSVTSDEQGRGNKDKENQEPEGLSTDDPREMGLSYASMMKKPDGAGHPNAK
ncbi:hypothetical protein W97_01419 [Coniosporium apollinis CBS 100218]|uniref:Elongation of fatty acids protein n=1 Tax=Coniosporium apollinis (strain CBS 100218) TaxID=1168221 RepID=R7YK70_CONA1|nr:uncharacterized protein W97_01419 [Coniosporium apollinis CBS 100218]EON62199.1 hypothetical protein W97_01419 [Coniosporium apollinis CBS 100218]